MRRERFPWVPLGALGVVGGLAYGLSFFPLLAAGLLVATGVGVALALRRT